MEEQEAGLKDLQRKQKHNLYQLKSLQTQLVKLSDKWMNGIHNPDDITIVVCKKLKN